jgi:GntR family transcriptional regulator, transcriptional repressor for pyruvate dehydrogenase complex
MPIQSIEPRRLYRQIADQLRELIRSGEFGVGSKLPSERDLAEQLGVSRPSVREALIALEVEGLVEIRSGSGVHVLAREPKRAADNAGAAAFGLFEIFRARQLVEGELAAIVAGKTTPALLKNLRAALAQMEAEIADGAMPIHGDRLFHTLIAEAADNGPLLRTVINLYDLRNNPLFEQFGHHFENASSWRKAVTEHKGVVKALAAHDPAAARAAMHHHLQRSHDRFAETWPQETDAPATRREPVKTSTQGAPK